MRLYIVLCVINLASPAHSDLYGSNVRCRESDGELVVVPGITTVNPCYTCRCHNGIVQCEDARRRCPSVAGCYNLEAKEPGQCCDKCRGCVVNGTAVVESGSSWTDPANPCSRYTCFSGVLTAEDVQCDAKCSTPTSPVPGECCPACRSCRLHGYTVAEGETIVDPADPCRDCQCKQGNLICQRKSCPVLSCPPHLQIKRAGHCCPQCPQRRSHFSPRNQCMFQSRLYAPTQTFKADTCTSCTCTTDLTTSCSRQGCLPAHTPPSCTDEAGESRPHDSTWNTDDCRTCACNEGVVECRRSQCPDCPPGTVPAPQPGECCPACRKVASPAANKDGVCTVFGDPHYKTFDGRIFNFQGSCKYLLTKDCLEGADNSNFSIRITNDARDTVAFSWLRTVTIRLGDTKVSLLQRMRVKVDGKKVNLPYIKLGVMSVIQDGYRVILRTIEGARILWDGVSFLELTVPARMAGRMCGLCGNFNGDRRDDMVGRHGGHLSSGQEFGNSWRVGGRKACSVLPRDVPARPPPCKEDWDANIRSSKHCAAIKSSLFEACHRRIHPEFYFKACRIDMCECPGTQCHCEVLTAYARECERAGVRIPRWREATDCTNIVPFKYSGEHFHSAEASATRQANATANEVLNFPLATGIGGGGGGGGEVIDDLMDDLDLGSLGRAKPAYRPPPTSKQVIGTRTYKDAKRTRKQNLRRLRRLERKREKERRRRERERERRARAKEGRRDRQKTLGSINGIMLKRVAAGGGQGAKSKLRWRSNNGDQSRPPFEVLLREQEEDETTSSWARGSPTETDSDDSTEFQNTHLNIHKVDYSELPNSKGRTPIPLRDSDSRNAGDNIHRKNWKRRRSIT